MLGWEGCLAPDPTAAVLLTKDTAHAPMDRGGGVDDGWVEKG